VRASTSDVGGTGFSDPGTASGIVRCGVGGSGLSLGAMLCVASAASCSTLASRGIWLMTMRTRAGGSTPVLLTRPVIGVRRTGTGCRASGD
jgi:hypothetical protein